MKALLGAVGVLMALAGPVAAQSSEIYLRGDFGLVFGTWSTETDLNPGAANASLGPNPLWGKTGTGVMVDIGAGYRFAPFLRLEGTIGYLPSIEFNGTFSNSTVTARSNISALVGLAAAYIDIAGLIGKLPHDIQPFVLGGAGFATVINSAENAYLNGQYVNSFSGATITNVAWTAGAGIGVPLTPSLMLDLTYRYLDLGQRRVGPLLTDPTGQFLLTQDRADMQVHNVMIGLRFAM